MPIALLLGKAPIQLLAFLSLLCPSNFFAGNFVLASTWLSHWANEQKKKINRCIALHCEIECPPCRSEHFFFFNTHTHTHKGEALIKAQRGKKGELNSHHMTTKSFRFLITTDNHLGFQEKDPRRCHDSFVTFEECLRAAVIEHDVDIILLAGDLFHFSSPSQHVMNRTIGLLRKYVMGNKPVGFTLLSDPAVNFPSHPVPCANFQDPNLNIAVPIFMIHGNHDDPLGDQSPSPIDTLASAGLVNHFGHSDSLENIVVRPVLLQKGNTFVALYGLGSMHDHRLHRCFERKQVQFLKPKDPPGVDGATWFRILLFHQNRGVRGSSADGPQPKGGIPESMLAGFHFDVIIWGNEHEQRIVPEQLVGSDGTEIIQPGSTVMTSLSGTECNPKRYGVMEVRGNQYRLIPYPLRSLRPVVRRTVELWKERPGARSMQAVEEYLETIANEMIEEAEEQIANIPDDVLNFHPDLKFPLMRLSVDFSSPEGGPSYPQPNANRFGQRFVEAVVNANDVLKPIKPKPKPHLAAAAIGPGAIVPVVAQFSVTDIRTKIASVFNSNARDACTLLSEPEVAAAVYQYADKGDKTAIDLTLERLLVESHHSIWKALRKSELDISAAISEDKIRILAQKYKADTTKKYIDLVGEEQAREVVPEDVLRQHLLGDAARQEVDELLLGGAGSSHHPLGAPLPRQNTKLESILVDDEDEADDDVANELAKLGIPLHPPQVDYPVDDDDCVVVAPPRSQAGAKKPPQPKKSTKRSRDQDDDVVAVAPPKGKKTVATSGGAPSGPKLVLSKTGTSGAVPSVASAVPVPPSATGAVKSIVSLWNR